YNIDIDIFNPIQDRHTLLTLETPFLVHSDEEIQRSDLLISYESGLRAALQRPIMSRILKDDTPEIYQALSLRAIGYDAITIRSILYQEKPQGEGGSSQAFQSVYQGNKIIYPDARGRTTFLDTLNLERIEPGKYLILILIYSGEGEPQVERVRFVKGRDIQRRIFADLDNSIRMMQYMAPENRLNELLQKDTIVVKEAEFRKTWDRLYPKDTQEKMEAYYQKVYEADERYPEPGKAGWQSHRGKIYILYGDPTEGMVEIRGKSYLRWVYPRWSLSFLFEERNQNWVLVE
ncbi:MAG: GWxTD domain-containing protein, partial [Bacteroidota bacterium]